jgi:hypothetical protein
MRALDPSGPRSRASEPARSGPQGPPPRRPRGALRFFGGSARSGTGSRYSSPRGRGRLVDYGAALEMRFGATRRGFESRPLRHLRHPREREWVRRPTPVLAHGRLSPLASVLIGRLPLRARAGGWRSSQLTVRSPYNALYGRSALDSACRARRGTSGALYLQTALAGLNSHPRSPFSRAAASSDVEDRVPRSGESRTVSGPEGSSTKRISSGAAERPGPSRSLRWARKRSGRRWVHGTQLPPARHRTGAQ